MYWDDVLLKTKSSGRRAAWWARRPRPDLEDEDECEEVTQDGQEQEEKITNLEEISKEEETGGYRKEYNSEGWEARSRLGLETKGTETLGLVSVSY